MQPEISVIITTYNQPFESIRASIMSVLLQRNVAYELIIADDCSKAGDYFQEYRKLFDENGFSDYRLIRNESNIQTVRNIIGALSYSRAEYVKLIDAGDMLYEANTLRKILDFCHQHKGFQVGYADIVRFEIDDVVEYRGRSYNAPRDAESIDYPLSISPETAFRKQLETADWIPASAQFYKTSYYRELLERLSKTYRVRYCQDFTATMALREVPIFHLQEPIYWYEWGTGISTNGGIESRKRLYNDHLHFYRSLFQECGDECGLKKAYTLFLLRRFVALRTPIYDMLLTLSKRHDGSTPVELNAFFWSCCTSCNRQ